MATDKIGGVKMINLMVVVGLMALFIVPGILFVEWLFSHDHENGDE